MGRNNAAADRRRWQTVRAERDDLPLFDFLPVPKSNDVVVVKCAGCASTATERRQRGFTIPLNWLACGQTADGATALFCATCARERMRQFVPLEFQELLTR